ncbi:aldehyde dehydrogenase family protein [Vibrio sp. RC27]
MMLDRRKFFIDGEWVEPNKSNDFDVLNPTTEQAIATISLGSADDVERAVSAAKRAFASYRETSVEERLALLERLLTIYQRRYNEMVEIITLELGAPTTMCAEEQAHTGIGHLEGFIEGLRRLKHRETLPNGDVLCREPIGVCGLITPWNWPINQIALKVLPALATGCACVLKPSEITPLNAMLYAEMIAEAGFPAGSFNLVNGDGTDVGSALTSHKDVEMVSFTGSTNAGIAISKSAADTIKRVTLELGGKSPNIIFEDTDLETSVTRGIESCFLNSGQSCDAPTRMLVQQSVYAQAVDIAQSVAERIEVGDPTKEGRHLGPLVSQLQFDRVQSMIEVGIVEGARLVIGGLGKPVGFETGYFVKPTVFADVTNTMRIAREEVFGPVLVMIPFDDEPQAIEIANDTDYGLAAYIETNDQAQAKRVAARLRAGMVHINGGYLQYGSPFGGYKRSGNGREGGLIGLEDFLEIKTLHYPE